MNSIGFSIVSPFPESHVPKMWAWMQDFTKQMVDDYSPHSLDELATKNKKDLEHGAKTYAVMVDEKPCGAVWGEHLGDNMYLGHLVFDRDNLDSRDKLDMARAVLRHFFHDGARKICWQMFADNRAFRIFLKKLGAAEEGCFRQATRRNGELVDVIVMASFPEDK